MVSIAGESVFEFRDLAAALEGYPGVSAIEANLSCPNVENGMEFATNEDLLTEAISLILEASSLPLFAKLSPNVTDIRPLAVAAQAAGAHGLTIMNTVLGMKIDVQGRRPFIGARFAGLSGPAVRPIGIRLVYEVWPEVDIPIVGVGRNHQRGRRPGISIRGSLRGSDWHVELRASYHGPRGHRRDRGPPPTIRSLTGRRSRGHGAPETCLARRKALPREENLHDISV